MVNREGRFRDVDVANESFRAAGKKRESQLAKEGKRVADLGRMSGQSIEGFKETGANVGSDDTYVRFPDKTPGPSFATPEGTPLRPAKSLLEKIPKRQRMQRVDAFTDLDIRETQPTTGSGVAVEDAEVFNNTEGIAKPEVTAEFAMDNDAPEEPMVIKAEKKSKVNKIGRVDSRDMANMLALAEQAEDATTDNDQPIEVKIPTSNKRRNKPAERQVDSTARPLEESLPGYLEKNINIRDNAKASYTSKLDAPEEDVEVMETDAFLENQPDTRNEGTGRFKKKETLRAPEILLNLEHSQELVRERTKSYYEKFAEGAHGIMATAGSFWGSLKIEAGKLATSQLEASKKVAKEAWVEMVADPFFGEAIEIANNLYDARDTHSTDDTIDITPDDSDTRVEATTGKYGVVRSVGLAGKDIYEGGKSAASAFLKLGFLKELGKKYQAQQEINAILNNPTELHFDTQQLNQGILEQWPDLAELEEMKAEKNLLTDRQKAMKTVTGQLQYAPFDAWKSVQGILKSTSEKAAELPRQAGTIFSELATELKSKVITAPFNLEQQQAQQSQERKEKSQEMHRGLLVDAAKMARDRLKRAGQESEVMSVHAELTKFTFENVSENALREFASLIDEKSRELTERLNDEIANIDAEINRQGGLSSTRKADLNRERKKLLAALSKRNHAKEYFHQAKDMVTQLQHLKNLEQQSADTRDVA